MPKVNKQVDAYIAKAQPFAQPILKHIRALVHETCPDCEEKIKWGFPAFDYKGPFMGMASFKAHAVFAFWKAKLIDDPKGLLVEDEAMGHGGRLTSLKDMPSDRDMKNFIKQAMKLNDEGIKIAKPKSAPKPEAQVPDYFAKALKKNALAKRVFEGFSPSQRREYIEWLTEAKTDATREKRLETAIEWISEGKIRNWKYVRK
jgi:uncharacterized protein YdeI (YjbR/CyaY-like superfamily)